MARARSKRKTHPNQLTLDRFFEIPKTAEPLPGSLDISSRLRNSLRLAIRQSGKDRIFIAAEMTALVFGDAGEGEITKSQLDSWTAPSRDGWRFPAEYLPAFVRATAAYWLLDHLAGFVGCKVLMGEQAALAEVGALEMQKEKLEHRMRQLKNSVGPAALKALLAEAGRG